MAGANGSAIFTPFRAIGCCSNGVPLSLSPQKKSSWIATSVGKTFHIYECDKLHLLCIGPLQENDVTCLIQNRLLTYAAVGDQIKIFKFGKYFSSIESGRVRIMALLGQQLVAVDDQNHLNVWDITTKVLYTDISFDSNEFKITSLVHPTTHLNKVILGSHQGSLHLWNIRTSHLVYSFPGWGSPVLVLTQSPALDVLGIGLGDGSVLLHNIRTDELVMKFHQEWGPVTSLSFRTDGVSVLASGSPSGHVTLWDLDERKLCSVMRETHSGSIAAVEYFPNLPLMITNGSDNAIKIWIFDESDGSGRLLKERCGHSAPPTMIRFHPTISRMIISAGSDHTLRLVLLHNQTVTRELSQGSVHKKKRSHLIESRKLSNIIDFSCDWQHQNRWDGLVSVHHNSSTCYTWDLMNYSIGKHAIKSKYAANYRAKPNCCCMSGCGHLFIVGMNTGHVEIFNIQSGLHRGELVHDSHPAHQSCVRGIASSLYYIITAGADGLIKVWSFRLKTLLKVVELPSPVTRISFHKESELLGVACDNFHVHVVDVNNGRIVRTFAGHCGKITDICISPDSRWLITSSVDCSVRTWDIPTGHMIDIFTCETPPTSVTMSPTSNFIATTHIDELGIFLWANKTLYSTVSLKPIPVDYQPSMIQLPSTGNEPVPCDRTGETTIGSTTGNVTGSPLCEGLLTLSALPKSQWHSLLYIDIIKVRQNQQN
jgi:U3 small nucleolar RNA-associated protein 21